MIKEAGQTLIGIHWCELKFEKENYSVKEGMPYAPLQWKSRPNLTIEASNLCMSIRFWRIYVIKEAGQTLIGMHWCELKFEKENYSVKEGMPYAPLQWKSRPNLTIEASNLCNISRQVLFIAQSGVAKTKEINSLLCTKIKPHTEPSHAY